MITKRENASKKNPEIRKFIIQEIEDHPGNIGSIAAHHFGVSRITINRYIRELIADKFIVASGQTKARMYRLNNIVDKTFTFPISVQSQEDVIWRQNLLPLLGGVEKNIVDICQYGVTELVNNVIDHSESNDCKIHLARNAKSITIDIIDTGVGIFEKIRKINNLDDPRHALLELSKGKLTTDPTKHSGEGIFFTSRMFDQFSILSGKLFYDRHMKDLDDWLIEVEDQAKYFQGTCVRLTINVDAQYTTAEVFNKYASSDEYNYGFMRTHVPVRLARYGNEQLVSRSQARRVLARFEKFAEVLLDFKDVDQIGQAFADEIFRVYKNEHPEINIVAIRTTPQIDGMIRHVEKK